MTGQPDEGKLESSGEEGQSTSPTSGEGVQPLPANVAAALKQLTDKIEEQARTIRGLQKGTDKQIAHQVDASIERILELAHEGKSKAQIERELWLDEMMQKKEGADAAAAPDKEAKADSPDMTKVVDEALQLPLNDSRVTDLKVKYANDPAGYVREALKLRDSLGQLEATPGEQPMPQGGTAKGSGNPIADIDDPKTLYRLAAQQMRGQGQGRRGTG